MLHKVNLPSAWENQASAFVYLKVGSVTLTAAWGRDTFGGCEGPGVQGEMVVFEEEGEPVEAMVSRGPKVSHFGQAHQCSHHAGKE